MEDNEAIEIIQKIAEEDEKESEKMIEKRDKKWIDFNQRKELLFYVFGHAEAAARMLARAHEKSPESERALKWRIARASDGCYDLMEWVEREISKMNQEYYRAIILKRKNKKGN